MAQHGTISDLAVCRVTVPGKAARAAAKNRLRIGRMALRKILFHLAMDESHTLFARHAPDKRQ